MANIILFLCNENAGRSQMAEAFFNHYNKNPEFKAISAGTTPATEIHPLVREVMGELDISMKGQAPKILTLHMINDAYKIYTMGCIKGCAFTPAEKTIEWRFDDPGQQSRFRVREIRDEIEEKIRELVEKLEKE